MKREQAKLRREAPDIGRQHLASLLRVVLPPDRDRVPNLSLPASLVIYSTKSPPSLSFRCAPASKPHFTPQCTRGAVATVWLLPLR
ncbi:hypothetical protein Pcinc_011986 [Petrolisthes cinctipes]|uniref:Uncharacterized protein n=1 Tax=Petrolisthes cinctipes TaxID=88211 RepID=A0AAE1FZS6_PETCI|nr:hypothetical protein Pcinc_011986 [Petrolisthes cinctipes]